MIPVPPVEMNPVPPVEMIPVPPVGIFPVPPVVIIPVPPVEMIPVPPVVVTIQLNPNPLTEQRRWYSTQTAFPRFLSHLALWAVQTLLQSIGIGGGVTTIHCQPLPLWVQDLFLCWQI